MQETCLKRQPQPKQSQNSQVVLDFVIDDLLERSKHGSKLMTFNGKRSLVDLYEELCDAVVYIKQLILEENEREKDCTQ